MLNVLQLWSSPILSTPFLWFVYIHLDFFLKRFKGAYIREHFQHYKQEWLETKKQKTKNTASD